MTPSFPSKTPAPVCIIIHQKPPIRKLPLCFIHSFSSNTFHKPNSSTKITEKEK